MKAWLKKMVVAGVLMIACSASLRPATAQSTPEAVRPGEPSRTVATEPLVASPRSESAEADVRFMQGMVPHHAQALVMTALVPARSTRRALRMIAERIEVSQVDEIAWMTRWLQDRGVDGADPDSRPHPNGAHHPHDAGHHALMPGMLTPEEMAQLTEATGPAFDQLFLQLMIRHHEGALLMVAELLATPGGAQAPEVFRFASDVEADQGAEIQRMRGLLDASPLPVPHRH